MVSINVSINTKKRYKDVKRIAQVKEHKDFSEDEFTNILLDKYEGKGK